MIRAFPVQPIFSISMCSAANQTVADACAQAVVIGLGSRSRGDDGVGPYLMSRLMTDLADASRIRGVVGANDALAILNAWQDAALAIVLDAAISGATAGTVHRLSDFGQAGDAQPRVREIAACSSHGVGLAEALELGQTLGRMPGRLLIFAIEAQSVEPGAGLSAAVTDSADTVLSEVRAALSPFINA